MDSGDLQQLLFCQKSIWYRPHMLTGCCCLPTASVLRNKAINRVPISFDQQVQASQGNTSYRNKEKLNTEVDGGGSLELVKPARESTSSRIKPFTSLKNAPGILSVRRSLLALPRRKKADSGQISALPSETSRFAPLIIVRKNSAGLHP